MQTNNCAISWQRVDNMPFGKEIISPYNLFCLLITLLLVVSADRAPPLINNKNFFLPDYHKRTLCFMTLLVLYYCIDSAKIIAEIIGHFTVLSNCYFKKRLKSLSTPYWNSKGQTISEWIYEVIISPKKWTKNCFCPHYLGQKSWQFFVRILGERMTSIKSFWNCLTFSMYIHICICTCNCVKEETTPTKVYAYYCYSIYSFSETNYSLFK